MSGRVKWIKFATDSFKNEKIIELKSMKNGDKFIVIWMELLCLAGLANNGGRLLKTKNTCTCEEVAKLTDRPVREIKEAISTLFRLKMVKFSMKRQIISIKNWTKYQNATKLEELRKTNRERVRRWRESKKCNGDVTLRNAPRIKSKNKNKNNKLTLINNNLSSKYLNKGKEEREGGFYSFEEYEIDHIPEVRVIDTGKVLIDDAELEVDKTLSWYQNLFKEKHPGNKYFKDNINEVSAIITLFVNLEYSLGNLEFYLEEYLKLDNEWLLGWKLRLFAKHFSRVMALINQKHTHEKQTVNTMYRDLGEYYDEKKKRREERDKKLTNDEKKEQKEETEVLVNKLKELYKDATVKRSRHSADDKKTNNRLSP